MRKLSALFLMLFATVTYSSPAHSKVYKDQPVGKYEASFDLRDESGTFLAFMKTKIYPALAEEAGNVSGDGRDFLGAIERGEGVEIRLTDDVTTLHVKFKNPHDSDDPERSGRSFGVVGTKRKNYLADASYAHFLDSLEQLSLDNEKELETFYRAILSILVNCDTSHVNKLSREGKQVAADFIAVYVAEQYRHLINGRDTDGDEENIGPASLGRGHNWDDAHLQVTLLAAFHAGQSKNLRYMVYEGELTNKVYDQDACLYRRPDDPERENAEMRTIKLKDYWQFSYANECPGRSGVNITRPEFQKMGTLITKSLSSGALRSDSAASLAEVLGGSTGGNLIKKVAEALISNSAPKKFPRGGNDLVEATVDFIMDSHRLADEITKSLVR